MEAMTVKELPLVLHAVEHDPFLDSMCGEVRPAAGEKTAAPVEADERVLTAVIHR
jgi:hypothetical protein